MRVACEHSRPLAESVPDSPLAPRTMHVRTTSVSHTFGNNPFNSDTELWRALYMFASPGYRSKSVSGMGVGWQGGVGVVGLAGWGVPTRVAGRG